MSEYMPRSHETTYLIKLYAKIGDDPAIIGAIWGYPVDVVNDIIAGKYDDQLSVKQRRILAATVPRVRRETQDRRLAEVEKAEKRNAELMREKTKVLEVEDVLYIRQKFVPFDREFGTMALARVFGVGKTTVANIVDNKSWTEFARTGEINPVYKKVKALALEGLDDVDIASIVGCGYKTIWKICRDCGVQVTASAEEIVDSLVQEGKSVSEIVQLTGVQKQFVWYVRQKRVRGA